MKKFFKKNRLFKILYIFLFTIFLFSIIEITSISTKYVNRPSVFFSVNNISNVQIKRLVRKLDIIYGKIYFFISPGQKKSFLTNDKLYNSLENEIIVSTSNQKHTLSNNLSLNNLDQWHRSHGNHSSNRFSNLKDINLSNVNNLELAWKFKFKKKGDIQANPIFADGMIYMPSTGKSIVALNPKNGKKIWEHNTNGRPGRRGIVYNKKNIPALYFCDNKDLVALNANTGKKINEFGNSGVVKLKNRCSVTPAIVNNNIAVATFEPALEIYDLSTGKLNWKFYLKENENKKLRYGGKRYDYSGGNPWGGISADVHREIIYLTTGNAGHYLAGVNRPGKNKLSNSVIAIDLKNQKKLWDFQEIEHDIWNLDIPAPPILTSITINSKKIDVVVAITKSGNTLLLDRLTGKPIFDYKKIKTPLSTIPGEKTAFYQKKIETPEPFAKQFFSIDDVTDLTTNGKNYIYNKTLKSNFGFFQPNSLDKKNITFGWFGGAEWMGASINSNTGVMYVTANNLPSETWLTKNTDKFEYYDYKSNFKLLVDEDGYPGSKPPWGTLTALDLNTGKIIWQVPFGEYSELSKKGIPITGTMNMGGATGTAGNLIFATGTIDKKLRAFNSKNGEEMWSYKLPFIGSGPPTIFSIDSEQYILVTSTGSISIFGAYPNKVKFGDWVYCFKLKK